MSDNRYNTTRILVTAVGIVLCVPVVTNTLQGAENQSQELSLADQALLQARRTEREQKLRNIPPTAMVHENAHSLDYLEEMLARLELTNPERNPILQVIEHSHQATLTGQTPLKIKEGLTALIAYMKQQPKDRKK